jgi:hypothetical protein
MRNTIALANALIFSITLLVTAQIAVASPSVLKIDDVKFVGSKLVILGEQFDNGDPPIVSIDGIGELHVVSADAVRIKANLPHGLEGNHTLTVSTGAGKNKIDEYALTFGGKISVVCIDWYLTAGHDNHIHAEAYLQYENGDPVIGATVVMGVTVDTGLKKDSREWLVMASSTGAYKGYNHGESCPLSVAKKSGATDQYCCIGLGAHEPFCPTGNYEAEVLSVQAPTGSNAVWDGKIPKNITYFDMDQFND